MKKNKFQIILLAVLFFIAPAYQSFSQVGYSPLVDSVINLITEQSVSTFDKELSGDVPTTIGGQPYTIASRNASAPGNIKAAQYILEHFQSYGYASRYQNFTSTGRNVIAVKPGTVHPNQQYIICAHYDDMPSGSTAPGADDNASGTSGVLEAARLLANLNLDYTVVFIAFDEEELGLYGSEAYADSADAHGDDILGVFNLDMIAFDSDNDNQLEVVTNDFSAPIAYFFVDIINTYVPALVPSVKFDETANSDHAPFWTYNYKAILSIEDLEDFNTYYHTTNDYFAHNNIPYFKRMVQAGVAALIAAAKDYKMTVEHTPIQSSNDVTDRIATFVINSNKTIATGANAPRLYYKIANGNFTPVNAFYQNDDTLKFIIPGQPLGTSVSYYFAAQDAAGEFIVSLPAGAKGINPPGTVPPANFYMYEVANIYTTQSCSNTVPRPINDQEHVRDTIEFTQNGTITDVNVNLSLTHSYDGDIYIELISPDGTAVMLSNRNGGGGDNYTNTTFDDEATATIGGGTPPYTGSFIPDQPLSSFDGMASAGDWVLHIYDGYSGDEGSLQSWCIQIQYASESALKDFISYSINGKEGVIDTLANSIQVELPMGTALNNLVANFETNGVSVKINGVEQQSGVTPNDFTNSPLVYSVQAEDGSSNDYSVYASASLDTTKTFTSFTISGNNGVINLALNSITVAVSETLAVNNLSPEFTFIGEEVLVNGEVQTSGVSVVDFSSGAVTYTVVAEDGSQKHFGVIIIFTGIIDNNSNENSLDMSVTPNPFKQSTDVQFTLLSEENVMIKIYDISGKEIACLTNDNFAAGTHNVRWNVENEASGIYYCKIFINNKVAATRKIVLTR